MPNTKATGLSVSAFLGSATYVSIWRARSSSSRAEEFRGAARYVTVIFVSRSTFSQQRYQNLQRMFTMMVRVVYSAGPFFS